MNPVTLMNAICRWSDPPPFDERWTKKIAVLCEYVAALKSLYAIRTKQYRARCDGTIRDTKLEGEFIAAANELERIEKFIGVRTTRRG